MEKKKIHWYGNSCGLSARTKYRRRSTPFPTQVTCQHCQREPPVQRALKALRSRAPETEGPGSS